MDFIDRIRQKSPAAKKRIAIATSAVMTLAIFGVWASVFHFGFSQKTADATATVANASDTDVNPLSAFWSVLSTGWDGLAKNINQAKTDINQAQNLVGELNSATSSEPMPLSQKDVIILNNITQ